MPPKSAAGRLRKYFAARSRSNAALKKNLLSLGTTAFLCYGFISNMSYSVCVSLAYYIFTSQTGLSPLARGQRAGFLAVYSGFFVMNNFLRPFRLGLAAYYTKHFDGIIQGIQRRLRVNRAVATFLVALVLNVCGTFAAMFLGIEMAALASGVRPRWELLLGPPR
jgi:hypothetical protein